MCNYAKGEILGVFGVEIVSPTIPHLPTEQSSIRPGWLDRMR